MKPKVRRPVLGSLLIVAAAGCAVIVADLVYYGAIVDIGSLRTENPTSTAFIRYRLRQWSHRDNPARLRMQWVGLSRVSNALRRAVIIAEDAKFWEHEGFDFEAINAAVRRDIGRRSFAVGASTISQQLAKNLFLSPRKSPVRKINEAILTWRIERALSKRRILELYLNVVEWGDGIFGIEAAAQRYFGVSAGELSAQQASRLAVILPNPLKVDPVSPSRYVMRKSERICRALYRAGLIPPALEQAVSDSGGGQAGGGGASETSGSGLDSSGSGLPVDSAESPGDSSQGRDGAAPEE